MKTITQMKALMFVLCFSALTMHAFVPPSSGNALNFDGINDHVTIPDNAMLDLMTGWTLETWVKRDVSGSQHSLIEKYNWSTGFGSYILRIQPSGQVSAWILDGFSSNNVLGSTVLSPGTWYHLAATFDPGTNTLKVYVNGVLEGTNNAATINPPASTTPVKLGSRGNDDGTPLNGSMDEVRIWNTPLSQAEIQANMNNEISTAPGLVASYHFNQGIANGNNAGVTTLNDASGNSNNGTLNNFALNGSSSNWVGGKLLSPPCATTNSFGPIWINSTYKAAGANDPQTYYWGLSEGTIVARPMNGVGPYTYQWSSSAGYTIKNNTSRTPRLWYPIGPQWVTVEITDVGSNCTIEDSVYIDWVDYTCNQPSIWYYELCNVNTQVTSCVQGTVNMRNLVSTGDYMFGPCVQPSKRALASTSNAFETFGFTVFPNPSNGEFTYVLNSSETASHAISIVDINGRTLYTETVESEGKLTTHELNLSNLSAGVYFLHIAGENNNVVERIVIQ